MTPAYHVWASRATTIHWGTCLCSPKELQRLSRKGRLGPHIATWLLLEEGTEAAGCLPRVPCFPSSIIRSYSSWPCCLISWEGEGTVFVEPWQPALRPSGSLCSRRGDTDRKEGQSRVSSPHIVSKTAPAGRIRVESIVFSVLVFNLIEMGSSGLDFLSPCFLN